jgi:hypothetical protein
MRALLVGLLVVFAAPTYRADKDDDKAKEVTEEFCKAVVANDLDAVMKTVDVPFTLNMGSPSAKTVQNTDELKDLIAKLLKNSVTEKVMSYKMGTIYDMAAIANYAKEKKMEHFSEQAEKLLGKSGCMVMIVKEDGTEIPGLLIRFKDGKALIASLPK